MTILPGTPVLPAGRDTRGTVIELKGEFAQVLTEGKTEWLEIGSLTDVSDELLDKLLQEDHDPVQDFILAVDAVRLLTEYQFNPYVLASCTKIEAFPHQIGRGSLGTGERPHHDSRRGGAGQDHHRCNDSK